MAKGTVLLEEHKRLGAKIVDFAGFLMPIRYKGINAEHINVRKNVGIFDVSHMGEVIIKGPEAGKAVDFLVTNAIAKVKPGRAVYSPVCYPEGGIVDDLIAYKVADDDYFICVNASNTDKDFEHFQKYVKGFDCELTNRSDEFSQVAIQGPKARTLLARFFGDEVVNMKPFRHKPANLYGRDVLLATTGYTGEQGYEVYMPNEIAAEFFRDLLTKGQDLGVAPIGLGARDTLRMEMKYCLYGNDIDKNTTPLEADLAWTVKLNKPDFLGKDVLVKQQKNGLKRRLVAFVVEGKGIPRHGYKCFDNNNEIGVVTSGAMSPIIGKAFGLGYVAIDFAEPGSVFDIDVKGLFRTRAKVVRPPIHKNA